MLSPDDCAKLILINMGAFNRINDENVDSFLISIKTIKAFSDRTRISKKFLKDLKRSLFDLGYVFIDFTDIDTQFAVISFNRFKEFTDLSYPRYLWGFIDDMYDHEDIDEAYDEMFNAEDDYDD